MAQRMMSVTRPMSVSVSENVFERLRQRDRYSDWLKQYDAIVRHGSKIKCYQLCHPRFQFPEHRQSKQVSDRAQQRQTAANKSDMKPASKTNKTLLLVKQMIAIIPTWAAKTRHSFKVVRNRPHQTRGQAGHTPLMTSTSGALHDRFADSGAQTRKSMQPKPEPSK